MVTNFIRPLLSSLEHTNKSLRYISEFKKKGFFENVVFLTLQGMKFDNHFKNFQHILDNSYIF